MPIDREQQYITSLYCRLSPLKRELACSEEFENSLATLADGTKIAQDNEGNIVFAQYASGVTVKRFDNLVLVLSADGSFWFGDSQGRWFRLD